ncbi:MAG: DUF4124 domain-containing protein [Gammaproteobacteria bacterium]|jgi:hypothetical protein|nr:DUF4124 domain-containing protein [Gammaproteobacteria bacterium]
MKKFTEASIHNITERHRYLKLLASLMLAFMLAPAVFATGVYKWVDDNGKIHYGSQRPQDASAEVVQLNESKPATRPDDAEEETAGAELSDDDKARQERDAYCKSERARLKTVEKTADIHEKGANGEVRKLSATDRNQRLNKIRANINQYCK